MYNGNKQPTELDELQSLDGDDVLIAQKQGERVKKIKLDNVINDSTVYNCGSDVAVNDLVYFDGTTLRKSSNNNLATTPPIAMVRAKATATTCLVQREGKRTGFSGLSIGQRYYLGENGGITNIPPTDNGRVRIHIGMAASPNTLFLDFNNINLIN